MARLKNPSFISNMAWPIGLDKNVRQFLKNLNIHFIDNASSEYFRKFKETTLEEIELAIKKWLNYEIGSFGILSYLKKIEHNFLTSYGFNRLFANSRKVRHLIEVLQKPVGSLLVKNQVFNSLNETLSKLLEPHVRIPLTNSLMEEISPTLEFTGYIQRRYQPMKKRQ